MIKFDSSTRQIFISGSLMAGPINLSDIDTILNNPSVSNKQQYSQQQQHQSVWILNAKLVINKGSTLTIYSNGTT